MAGLQQLFFKALIGLYSWSDPERLCKNNFPLSEACEWVAAGDNLL